MLADRQSESALGTTPAADVAVYSPCPFEESAHEDGDLIKMTVGEMVATFDKKYGSLYSVKHRSDDLGTNFIGNGDNTPGVDLTDTYWTGDIVTTVWEITEPNWASIDLTSPSKPTGRWTRQSTGKSADIRKARFDGPTFSVNYDGQSKNEGGIRSFRLAMAFHAGDDNALLWDIEIQNLTNQALEIGELGLPLMVNNDYAEVYRGETAHKVQIEGRTPLMQKLIHEQKVFAHHFIGGHSSYALVERPLGDAPFLLVHPTGDTALECIYKPQSTFAARVERWEGPDVLAIYSRATKVLRGWRDSWVNGHSSLLLQPGQHRSFQIRFVFVGDYSAIREELYKSGNLGVRILPSMVVQENAEAYVEVKSQSDLEEISPLSDGVVVKQKTRTNEKTLLTLTFKGRGQKTLQLTHGGGRWTNLHFYCIEDIEQLLKRRGQFVVDRQFFENPNDPFNRNHMFLPFDYRRGSTFRDGDEVWEVGGSDEFGFSEPLFIAEKNVHYPSKEEVEKLETYVSDCLFKYIQDPRTYEVRASLFWKRRTPSSPWGWWSKERSETTWRTYNYPHPANIYHALYTIGKEYGILRRRTPEEYLRMSYKTCMKWFTVGPWKHVGLMGGSNVLNILDDLKREGWGKEHKELLEAIKICNDGYLKDPYPYSSELVIDQTAHEQVYFFTRHFGNSEKNLRTLQVIKALRGGNQTVWFRYGIDKRGVMACWYSESLYGMALL